MSSVTTRNPADKSGDPPVGSGKAATPTAATTALVPGTSAAISNEEQYRQALDSWRSRYNVLTPVVSFSGLAPSYGLIASLVQLDPNPNSDPGKGAVGVGDVYQDGVFSKGQDVALTKTALRKIADAAALSVTTTRTDPRTIPHYWEVKARVSWRGIDGTIITREATVEYDLRDGSPRVRSFTPAQLLQARVTGLRGAEARAINAAIREYGIKQVYTKKEIERPFVVIHAAYIPDMNDPAIRLMVAQQSMEGTTSLYARQMSAGAIHEPQPLDAFGNLEPAAPRAIGAGSTTAAPRADVSGLPLVVVSVTPVQGKTQDREWTRYDVVFNDKRRAATFSATLAADARALIGKPCDAVLTTDEQDRLQLTDIGPAGTRPQLPGMDGL